MNKPDIGVVYEEGISGDFFGKFQDDVQADGLSLVVESREPMGAMACAEWFIIPAVGAFIASSYFSGFLKKMGKEHFHSLKASLSNLTNDVMATPRIEPTLFSTDGKVSSNNPFSLAFSVHADAEDGNTFKLLIPKTVLGGDYGSITNKFMEFLSDYHLGLQSLDSIGCAWKSERPPSGMIFVHYNSKTDSIEWLDEQDYR